MNIVKKGVAAVAVLSLLALPVLVGAQPTDPGSAGPESVGGLIDLLFRILAWVRAIFWILAGIFILYAAFLYLTAGGDEDKVKKASQTFLYAVIAVAIAIFAQILPTFVRNFLAGQ